MFINRPFLLKILSSFSSGLNSVCFTVLRTLICFLCFVSCRCPGFFHWTIYVNKFIPQSQTEVYRTKSAWRLPENVISMSEIPERVYHNLTIRNDHECIMLGDWRVCHKSVIKTLLDRLMAYGFADRYFHTTPQALWEKITSKSQNVLIHF